jgi:orotate phosphoribosyltransferase
MIMNPLTPQEVLDIFSEAGGLLKGHFLLTSGLHSNTYLEKFQVLQHPKYTERLCAELARRFAGEGVEVVVGPVTGGIILAYEVARQLGARAIFTEREGGVMCLRRGFAVNPGEKVLVVEDIVTTGGSVQEVLSVLQRTPGQIVGVGLLIDRSGGKVDFGVPTEALLKLDIDAWEPSDCPLCRENMPITKRGSRQIVANEGV